jgi:hypothetical protein
VQEANALGRSIGGMAKGIQMHVARRSSGAEVLLSDLVSGDTDLTCVDCGVPVRFVPEHPKNNCTIYVGRYVGLIRKEHRDTCRFSAHTVLNRLVADANHATGQEMFVRVQGIIEYRLNILDTKLAAARRPFALQDASAGGNERSRVAYVSSGSILSQYLRCATAVARLYARLEGKAEREFRNAVVIRQHEQILPWSKFCYNPEQYALLGRRLAKGPIRHSVAVVFRLTSMTPGNNDRVRLESEDVQFDQGIRIKIRLFALPEIAATMKIGEIYVAVGQVFLGDYGARPGIFPIRMMIEYLAQIAKVMDALA